MHALLHEARASGHHFDAAAQVILQEGKMLDDLGWDILLLSQVLDVKWAASIAGTMCPYWPVLNGSTLLLNNASQSFLGTDGFLAGYAALLW